MPFWHWCPKLDDEQIEEILTKYTLVIKVVSPKIYNLRSKGSVPNTCSFKEDIIPLRKITPPPVLPKQNDATQRKNNNNVGKKCLSK
jgi:hypothetical protein